jgi:outer membrane protein assembly factor BamD
MRLRHTLKVLVSAAVLVMGVTACASSGPPAGTSTAADADKVLLDRGNAALTDRKWSSARQYFTKLLDSYPQSAYRADAKLGVGDSYQGEETSGSFVFALNEYREFLAFYPTNARADYAQFQLATVHFKQMLAPGRDQTETKEAIREFQAFVDRYPNSSMFGDGQKRLREAKDRLDDYEYGVGLFYVRIRAYSSAINRFKPLLETDPGYTRRDAVYFYLAEALEKSDNTKKAEALPYYERLVKEFEKSQYLEEAKRRIELLKQSTPAAGL